MSGMQLRLEWRVTPSRPDELMSLLHMGVMLKS